MIQYRPVSFIAKYIMWSYCIITFAAALFLDDLIQYFKEHGWNVIDATEAYQDEIYQTVTKVIPAGESLIWSMAKQTGKILKTSYDIQRKMESTRRDGMDRLGL